jgi:hypothetical protein
VGSVSAPSRIAASVALVGFVVAAGLQALLAVGVLPITLAWGGTQTVLTVPLRLASLASAMIMGLFALVIRRRTAPRPPRTVRALAWVIGTLLTLNTAANFVSQSRGEAALFGPLTLLLAVSSLLVAAGRADGAPQSKPKRQTAASKNAAA